MHRCQIHKIMTSKVFKWNTELFKKTVIKLRNKLYFFQIKKPEDSLPVVRASISDKKVSTKMEPSKDFGSFSALLAPSLLSGKTTVTSNDEDTSSNRMTSNKLSTKNNLSTNNNYSTSKLSSSSLLTSEKKDETFNYSSTSTLNDKYESNNNLSSSYNEDNNNSVNR